MTREQWLRDQAFVLSRLAEQKAALAQAEQMLHEQRKSLEDILPILVQAQEAPEPSDPGELQQLRAENEQLQFMLPTLEHEREQAVAAVALAEARAAELEKQPDQVGEITVLRELLIQKDAIIEELRNQPAPSPTNGDPDSYESELNEFRRQLEADRKKLSREIEQVRARNAELDDATRELELEMSRERAELGRERQRLDRLRDDVRLEAERMHRDGGLKDRLAPVQTLRDVITHKRQ